MAGHTKNPCNRTFNLLKLKCHKKNVRDVDDPIKTLNSHVLVSAKNAPEFCDRDSCFDDLHTRPVSIKRLHCFEITRQDNDEASLTALSVRPRKNKQQVTLERQPRILTGMAELWNFHLVRKARNAHDEEG